MNTSKPGQTLAQPPRYRFGTRWLLVLMLVFSGVFAWFARESHRARSQTQLVSELAQLEVRVRTGEPTGLALVARRLLGSSDVWLAEKMGSGWFWRPLVLVSWTLTDEQVPDVIEPIKRLGGVQELHLEQSPVSQQGISTLQNQLPDIAILIGADTVNLKPRLTERFAAPAFGYIATVGIGILSVLIVLVWPLLRRRFGEVPVA